MVKVWVRVRVMAHIKAKVKVRAIIKVRVKVCVRVMVRISVPSAKQIERCHSCFLSQQTNGKLRGRPLHDSRRHLGGSWLRAKNRSQSDSTSGDELADTVPPPEAWKVTWSVLTAPSDAHPIRTTSKPEV